MKLKVYVRWLILGGVLFFLAKALKDNWQEVAQIQISPQGWVYLGSALVITLLAHIWTGWVWSWIFQSLNQKVSSQWAVRVYLKTNIAKYIPGNIWHYYGRIRLATDANIPPSIATLSVLLEPLLLAAAALLVALVGSAPQNRGLQVFSLAIVLIAIHPLILNHGIKLVSKLKNKGDEVKKIEHYPFLPLLGELGFLGLIVWAHHMFTSGIPGWLRMFFMITTMIIAVPTGIKVFSWLATLWGGKLRLNSALLFAMGFVGTFVIGGISGVMLAAVPFDIHVHDTYFVVAHLHYVLFGGSVLGIYSGYYHWFPKATGRMINEFWGKVHFALTIVGLNLAFLPMHKLGLMGMNRRIAMYDPKYETLNFICTMGAYLLAISTFPFIINAIWSWHYGPKAGDNPWEALTLEWMTTSPPAIENFDALPVLATGPYDYGMNNKKDVDVPLADEREPALAAGPSSVLRAEPDPNVAANPEDRK